MPIHDWTRVEAGVFHHFHHRWIAAITDALNDGLLPPEYYALAEQQAAGFGPDILTLQVAPPDETYDSSRVVIRHVSGDDMVAVVEIVSPGNKGGRNALKNLVEKACDLLEHRIHLLIIDLFPPTKRDPHGLHAAIWEEITDEAMPPPDKPLTLVAYESDLTIKAYIEPVAVGDMLPDMPLFLEPGAHVLVPLEATYQAAWAAVPRRWRAVLEPAAG
jgi:hypothetical protein